VIILKFGHTPKVKSDLSELDVTNSVILRYAHSMSVYNSNKGHSGRQNDDGTSSILVSRSPVIDTRVLTDLV
jgi:hypothetical protein